MASTLLVYRHEPLEEATATRAVRNSLFSLSVCSLQHPANLPRFRPLQSIQIPVGFICILVAKSPLFLEPGRVLRQLGHCTCQIHGHQIYHRVFVSVLSCFVGIPADYLGDRSDIQKPFVFSFSKKKFRRRIPGIGCYLGGFQGRQYQFM